MIAPTFRCAGCGALVPAAGPGRYPFRCPNAREGDDIDHVVRRQFNPAGQRFPDSGEPNPFLRYRAFLSSYALGRACGLTDGTFCSIVGELDDAVARVDGGGFRERPFAPARTLAERLGCSAGEVWVKDETGNVSGSHKGRHLMGVMLYLEVARRLELPSGTAGGSDAVPSAGPAGSRPPLAIASCGNAALAAAVLARAADWPLHVFVPPSAQEPVVARLAGLGARVHTCHRQPGVAGDPCYLAFRTEIARGAVPFCCQGSDNGLTIEGGETLAWEMVAALLREDADDPHAVRGGLDAVFVQVGGGALASAVILGFMDAAALGVIDRLPRICTVQTHGAYPLRRAYDRLAVRILARVSPAAGAGSGPSDERQRADLMARHPDVIDEELRAARLRRSAFMRPWETEPRSIAHGILDDETYDWAMVVEGMLRTGGWPLVVGEERLIEANALARETTGIDVDHTGSAGLAGLMDAMRVDARLADERVAVVFSGVRRAE